MSVFTNPASASAEHAQAYITAVLGLLGSADAQEVLRSTPEALRQATAGMSAAELATPEREGKWSVGQVLRHLADSDLVWGWRLRLVLAEERPVLAGYDQDAWADRLRYVEEDPTESLAEFAVLRRSNLRLLGRATPEERKRVGVHAERGEESVEHLMRLYAGHDLLHLRQVERIRKVVAGR